MHKNIILSLYGFKLYFSTDIGNCWKLESNVVVVLVDIVLKLNTTFPKEKRKENT